jgi:cephalosporin hydroxylase
MPYMEEYLDMPVRQLLEIIQNRILHDSVYFGVKALKSPTDFWIYQEIIFETKPDYIIEIGNASGGSTLAMAHICDCLRKGRVIGLDLSHDAVPEIVRNHPRISLLEGDACELFEDIRRLIKDEDSVLIIEDSAHTFENTMKVLRTYSPLVKPGGYFIVEDSICHHGLETGPNPGPYEAVEAFLAENKQFEVDRAKESFFITWNPKGYLKRVV